MTYKTAYRFLQLRRFCLQSLMIAVFQFLIIINLTFIYPALPMYPPIGTAFTLFYLFGFNAIVGLAFASVLAYYLKGFPPDTLLLYLAADMIPAYLSSIVSCRYLSSDIIPFQKWREVLKFIGINAGFCFLSAFIRFIPLLLHSPKMIPTHWDLLGFFVLIFNYLDLWLSDLNAILILSSFLLSWAYLSFSRQIVFPGRFPKEMIIVAIVITLVSILGLRYASAMILIFVAMIGTLILAYRHGYLVGTALLFITASLYLIFFMVNVKPFVHYFGLALYTFVPLVLHFFAIGVLYLGHRKLASP